MGKNSNFSIKDRIKSFKYAFKGINYLINFEHNARIHLVATIVVAVAGLIYKINAIEWCFVIVSIALVWITEAFNTIVELFVDHLWPNYHETAGKIKDVAAAIVLLCALAPVLIAAIIFIPKMF